MDIRDAYAHESCDCNCEIFPALWECAVNLGFRAVPSSDIQAEERHFRARLSLLHLLVPKVQGFQDEISCHDTHRPPEAMKNIALVLQNTISKILSRVQGPFLSLMIVM
jgi:hypothetical protein